MSQPHTKYSRTMFIVEGIQTAILVTRTGRRRAETRKRFATPEAALAWCRQHQVVMVYLPEANPAHN